MSSYYYKIWYYIDDWGSEHVRVDKHYPKIYTGVYNLEYEDKYKFLKDLYTRKVILDDNVPDNWLEIFLK